MPNKPIGVEKNLPDKTPTPEKITEQISTEKRPQPEVGFEVAPEKKIRTKESGEHFLQETTEGIKKVLKRPQKNSAQIPYIRDELTKKIEVIMEEGLKEAFQELPIIEQQEFKIKGEETAFKIRELLKSTHVKVKKIFRLLLDWLRMLPGINRFFLEQEAKIKADKIITLQQIHNNKN